MPLRLKLFLGISLFFILSLSFFGYMAYDAAMQSGNARERTLLQDIASGMGKDLQSDIGRQPKPAVIESWLNQFNSLHLSIMVAKGQHAWLSKSARHQLPGEVVHQIKTASRSGDMKVGKRTFVWDTSHIGHTGYQLTVIHHASSLELRALSKQLIVPLVIAALIILWVAGWSTQYIATLLQKLNDQKDKLRYQAMHDSLTGLPNRALMLERLLATMREVDQSNAELALLFIDLNRFKEINDSLGHHYGDLLLVALSQRLQQLLRRSDMIARLGGDEFAVILGHVSEAEACSIASKINSTIGQEIDIEGHVLAVNASIGIALYPVHTPDANALLRYADHAMYAAKRAGHDYVVYDPDHSNADLLQS